MTLPDLAVAATEAESAQKRSHRALAVTTGGGRANDHSLKIISLCYDLIEKGRRTAGGRPAAWLAVQCASAQKLSTRRRGAQNFPLFGRQDAFLPFIWNRVPERWPAKSSTSSNPAYALREVDRTEAFSRLTARRITKQVAASRFLSRAIQPEAREPMPRCEIQHQLAI